MVSRLSMPNLLAALIFSAACGAHAQIGATLIRQAGDSLDPSIRNETDHAVRMAATWLGQQQNSDGSWGASNRVQLTSLALFALKSAAPAGHSDAATRAALWLDRHAANRTDGLETHAWRLLAVAQVLPESPDRAALLCRLADAGRAAEAGAPADALRLWREALAAVGQGAGAPPDADAPARLAALAAAWPPAEADTARAWRAAHLVNRAGNGQLLSGNAPLDWRRDLAQRLINAQRSAPAGGGFWSAPDADARIAETTFGILALLEL